MYTEETKTNASAQYVWSKFKIPEGSPNGRGKAMEESV